MSNQDKVPSINEITGSILSTKPSSQTYRDNWDRIFSNKDDGKGDRIFHKKEDYGTITEKIMNLELECRQSISQTDVEAP